MTQPSLRPDLGQSQTREQTRWNLECPTPVSGGTLCGMCRGYREVGEGV
jgi:hypothetical protein